MRVITLMTPDHTTFQVYSSGRVAPKLVGIFVKALTRDATRRFRFVVHAAGWLHSMVLHGGSTAVTVVAQTSYCLRPSYFDRKPMK